MKQKTKNMTEPLLDSWINDAVDHSRLQPNTKYLPPIHKIRRRVRTLQLLNKTMPDRPPVAGSTKINLSHIGASKVSTRHIDPGFNTFQKPIHTSLFGNIDV